MNRVAASTPANLELASLEMEAKAKAQKQVANLLQRPDQLEKVEQIRKRVTRKKVSVEAMLKTAVQSQLDGVRTGITQLRTALEDIRDIKQGLVEVDETYRSIAHLGDKLKNVREENSRHSQLGAAVENLNHIFNVPEVVKKIQGNIEDGKLLHAHKSLTQLEMARDDLLYELHRQTNDSPTDKNTVSRYFEEVEKLSDQLAKQLWLIIHRTLVTIRREPTVIVTVLRIIEREERMDAMMLKRYDQTSFLPPGRPKRWRQKCFTVLEDSVQSRIEGSQTDDRAMDKMWLVRHLEVIRQLVIEDLRVVKKLFEEVFPPYYDIIKKYIAMYHNAISQHLLDNKEQGLEGNEIVGLLTWVGSYNTKELMQHPDLQIDTSELGPLLETSVIQELQNQYLQTLRNNFQEWMGNSLRSDIKDWFQDSEPDADDRGFFNTSIPVILFQMIEQNLQVASTITENLMLNVLYMCVDELDFFSHTYKAELKNYRDKHAVNRSQPKYYLHYLIANINNCHTFSEFIKSLHQKYCKNATDDSANTPKFQAVAQKYHNFATETCSFLLDEVFLDLDTHTSHLMSRQWVNDSNAVDTICITLEDYCQDFVHLRDVYFFVLLEKAQSRVASVYIEAIFAKKMSFKSYTERVQGAEKICQEVEQLRQLFSRLTSRTLAETPLDILPMFAEVIKLKDTTTMSFELLGIVNKYPDIKPDQLINVLLMRGDVGRSDARQLISETIGEEEMNKSRPVGFFTSLVST